MCKVMAVEKVGWTWSYQDITPRQGCRKGLSLYCRGLLIPMHRQPTIQSTGMI